MCGAIEMKRFSVRLLVAAMLGCGALLLIAARTASPPPVYSVATVQAGLIRSPNGWIGRTIRVRAVVGTPCTSWMAGANSVCISSWWMALLDANAPRAVVGGPCLAWRIGAPPVCDSSLPALPDAIVPGASAALPMRGAPSPPLLAALRRLPLAHFLLGSPQQVRWGAPATYHVQLQAAPTAACGVPLCYEALLLDAAPGSR